MRRCSTRLCLFAFSLISLGGGYAAFASLASVSDQEKSCCSKGEKTGDKSCCAGKEKSCCSKGEKTGDKSCCAGKEKSCCSKGEKTGDKSCCAGKEKSCCSKAEKTGDKDRIKSSDLTLRIQGMSCKNCAAHVETALRQVPTVDQAKVDHQSGLAEVYAKSDSKLAAEDLVKAVEKAGYHAKLKDTRNP